MLRRWIDNLLDRRPPPTPLASQAPAAPPAVVVVTAVAPGQLESPGVPVYPPLDSGIQVIDAAQLLASQQVILGRLKRHLSLPEADYERRYLGPIRRLADFVGQLPATAGRHHSGPGGLFRYCLQMAASAAKSADGMLFAGDAPVEKKRVTEAAWRQATFLAALCADLYRPLTDLQVIDPKGNTWAPYLGGMSEWARSKGADRVYLRWVETPAGPAQQLNRGAATFALNAIAGEHLLADLHAVSPNIVVSVVGVVTGTHGALSDLPMVKAVNLARRSTIEADEALQPRMYGRLVQGSHLEPLLLDGMRELVRSGKWTINEASSVLQYGQDGLYLVWPLAGHQLRALLSEKKVDGIPSNPSTLAEVLLRAGAIAKAADDTPYYAIRPATEEKGSTKRLAALRLVRPESILQPLEDLKLPGPVAVMLGVGSGPTGAAAAQKPREGDPPTAPVQPLQAGFTPPPRSGVELGGKESKGDSVQPPAGTGVPIEAPPGTSAEPLGQLQIDAGDQSLKPKTAKPERPKSSAKAEVAPAAATQAEASPSPNQSVSPPAPDGLPVDVVANIGAPVARVIARVRDCYNRGQSPNSFRVVDDGLAVSCSLVIEISPLDIARIQEPLKSGGLLVLTSGGDGRGQKPIHFLEVDGKKTQFYVLKRDFARHCGFVLP